MKKEMNPAAEYTKAQAVTLSGEQAFEELYARLARWTREAAESSNSGDFGKFDQLVDKCLSLIGYMDQCVDLSANYDVASRILSLHRFAIGALVKAKAERTASALSGLPEVFVSLAEIFAAIRTTQTRAA